MSGFATHVNICVSISISALEGHMSSDGTPGNGNIAYNFLKRFGFNTM